MKCAIARYPRLSGFSITIPRTDISRYLPVLRLPFEIVSPIASVSLRGDFADFGAYDVVGRGLGKLVGAGMLVQVGYGLYARAKRSVLSGKPIPVAPLIGIGYQALRRFFATVATAQRAVKGRGSWGMPGAEARYPSDL